MSVLDLRQGKAGIAYIHRFRRSAVQVESSSSTSTAAKSWRKLSGHKSTSPDPTFIPVVEGERLAVRQKGKSPAPFNVASDGIAISADGMTLLLLPSLEPAPLFHPDGGSCGSIHVRGSCRTGRCRLGREGGPSDGLEADNEGGLYAGDYEHNGVRRRRQMANGGPLRTMRESYGPTRFPVAS